MNIKEDFTTSIALQYNAAAKEYVRVLDYPDQAALPARNYPLARAWGRSHLDKPVAQPAPGSLQAFVVWLEQHPSFVSVAEDRRHLGKLRALEAKREEQMRCLMNVPLIGLGN